MYADEIRRAVEASNRIALPQVTALLWRAYREGKVTEAEAEALSALIEARQVSAPRRGGNASEAGISNMGNSHVLRSPDPAASKDMVRISSDVAPLAELRMSLSENPIMPSDRQRSPRTGAGSRPRTDASLERRRRWAASGRLPPALAARFTLAEQAVLALIAAETTRRGDCRLSVPHLAALAGVAETTARNAIREARRLGLLTVEERRVTGFRNLPNVVRIVSPEWVAWLRLARKGQGLKSQPQLLPHRGGCKSPNRTPTPVLEQGKTRPADRSKVLMAQARKP